METTIHHYKEPEENFESLASEDYERMLERTDATLILERLFKILPPRTVKIIKMRFYQGLLYKDIARKEKVSQQRVKQIVNKALHRIQKHILKESGYID